MSRRVVCASRPVASPLRALASGLGSVHGARRGGALRGWGLGRCARPAGPLRRGGLGARTSRSSRLCGEPVPRARDARVLGTERCVECGSSALGRTWAGNTPKRSKRRRREAGAEVSEPETPRRGQRAGPGSRGRGRSSPPPASSPCRGVWLAEPAGPSVVWKIGSSKAVSPAVACDLVEGGGRSGFIILVCGGTRSSLKVIFCKSAPV